MHTLGVDEAASIVRASWAHTQTVTEASIHLMLASQEVGVAVSWLSKDDGAGEGSGAPQGNTCPFSPRNLSGSKQHRLAYMFPTRAPFGLPQQAAV